MYDHVPPTNIAESPQEEYPVAQVGTLYDPPVTQSVPAEVQVAEPIMASPNPVQ